MKSLGVEPKALAFLGFMVLGLWGEGIYEGLGGVIRV